jgi:hypothetical protein
MFGAKTFFFPFLDVPAIAASAEDLKSFKVVSHMLIEFEALGAKY